jgi:hypothetical protein
MFSINSYETEGTIAQQTGKKITSPYMSLAHKELDAGAMQ